MMLYNQRGYLTCKYRICHHTVTVWKEICYLRSVYFKESSRKELMLWLNSRRCFV